MNESQYREAEEAWFASQGVEPAERRVRLPRLDVEVRVQELGEGAPTLFIHGGPNSGSTWMQVAGRVRGLRCLILDRPGTGLSDPHPSPVGRHSLTSIAAVMAVDVLDALEVERAHVVASSLGGFIALHSAAARPDRFNRMVQMACPAFAPGMRTPPFMRLLMTPGLGRMIRSLPPTPKANRSILRQIGHGTSLDTGRIPEEFLDWYLALQRHTDTMAHEGRAIARLGTPFGFDSSLTIPDEVLSRVVAPTCFLWGEEDTFGGVEVAHRIVAAMPAAEFEVLPAAGHLPWIDDPDRAAEVVTSFLAAHDRHDNLR